MKKVQILGNALFKYLVIAALGVLIYPEKLGAQLLILVLGIFIALISEAKNLTEDDN